MKLTLIIFALTLSSSIIAQDLRDTFAVTYGIGSAPYLMDVDKDFPDSQIGRDLYTIEDTRNTGNVSLSYFYNMSSSFAPGVVLSYETIDNELNLLNNTDGQFLTELYILQFHARFYYVNNDMVRLYSDLGLGGGIRREVVVSDTTEYVNSNFTPSYHINLAGFEYGRRYGIKVGLGYGFHGIVLFGFFSRL
jgi:hypothetical protein